MAKSSTGWMRAAAVIVFVTQTAAVQPRRSFAPPLGARADGSNQCYYPGGGPAPDSEKPCSTAPGSACCPDTWECLDNGLCHLPTGNLYGRYSCTDKSWKSPGCASNMCTYGGTATGGESITQCSNHNNDWCCNADATHVNCCQESPEPRPFFALQDGKAYATIGQNQASSVVSVAQNTGLALGSGTAGSAPSKTPSPSASSDGPTANAASTSAAPSPTPFTSVSVTVSSGPAGVATVSVVVTVTPSANPTADPSTSTSTEHKSHIGPIVGGAVGGVLFLVLLGIVFWLLRKRRNQKANTYKETPDLGGNGAGFAGGAGAKLGKKEKYRNSHPGAPEIDGNPVGTGRPVSTLPGHAELDSGAGFQPGHGTAYAPGTVGIGGGTGEGRSTWGSAPPGYSPGMGQTGFTHPPAATELDATSVLPVVNEKPAGPQQYQAYRPPPAELPTIKTPPEDVEKQLHR